MLIHRRHLRLKLTDVDFVNKRSIFEGAKRKFLELWDQNENNK